MIGKTIAHYEITGLLGKGGMGEVYRARDTKLGREVALKVLPAELARDPVRLERLQREARIVAGLTHPNIVTLFSVEEDAGTHFLTMELVEGQGLDEVVTSGGLLLSDVLDTGIAVADALAAAHENGIIHRDLKPANVKMTPDGHVKVLDFGLAKLVRESVEEQAVTQVSPLTAEGTIVGTVQYMSPEQLRGQAIDPRSDLFSFGVLLYEIATGTPPFRGKTRTDVISSILRDAPPSLEQARPDLPSQLGRIIDRCLQKEPGDRFASARDLRNELRDLRRDVDSGAASSSTGATRTRSRRGWWIGLTLAVVAAIALFAWKGRDHGAANQAVTESTNEKTIAVLPFVNMSGDPGQDYFSDGISEELLNLLTQVPGLRVAARTSSFSFKGKDVGVPEIAKSLNVAYVLEGSVRQAGDRVRIIAQLIHAPDGFHVWSETYDRTFDDIFAIQDAIAADVVKRLEVTLFSGAPKTRKTDPEAFALYLQSVQLSRQNNPEGFARSEELLHRVLKIDSLYAPAWGGLGANYGNRAVSGMMDPAEGFARAREANLHALAIDPNYAPAHAGLAFIAMYGESNFSDAAKHLEHAVALDPTNARALGNSATLLNLLGRPAEAIKVWESVTARDPLNVNAFFNLGTCQLNDGRLDDAIATFHTVLSLSPGNGVAHYQAGVAMALKGDGAGSLAEFQQETVEVFRMIGLPVAYHVLGRKAESDTALNELIAKYEKDAAGNIAGVYAFRGERDRAWEWMEKERANGSTFAEILVDPLYRNLHDDPRWLPFLRKTGKGPEQLSRVEFKVPLPRV